jgi:hypothetical protein
MDTEDHHYCLRKFARVDGNLKLFYTSKRRKSMRMDPYILMSFNRIMAEAQAVQELYRK